MRQRYLPYQDVKPSGVKWLGDIPSHWECLPGHRLFGERKERMRADDEMLTASQKYGVIPQAEFMQLEDQKVMQVYLNAEILKHVEPNDFVISMRSFQGGLEFSEYSGCVSSAYVGVFAVKHVEPTFFKHLFKSSPYIQALQGTSNLVRDGQALRFQNFSMVRLPVIPLDEQQQIASFLDYETGKIDALIEKQQQLIALLGEKRQAVISHAVTQGLNPDAPMRDSGIEWLGEVPEHWEVLATSRVCDLTTGDRDTQDAIPGGKYPFFVRSDNIERIDTYSFDGEGVLTSGDGAGVGKIFHHFTGRFEFHQRVYLFHNFKRISGRYFFYFLREHLAIVALAGNAKSTVDSLRRPMLRMFPMCLPPIEEQQAITAYLDNKVTRIDDLITIQHEFSDLLQERRTALISAAVTGKIDVRGWKPPSSARMPETEMEVA